MMKRTEENAPIAKLWFRTHEESMIVVFEPLADEFSIQPGSDVFLELPAADLALLEIFVWKHGISVTLPSPGENTVLDHTGNVISQV